MGHGLDHRQPERLEGGGGQQYRCSGQQPVGLGHVANQLHRPAMSRRSTSWSRDGRRAPCPATTRRQPSRASPLRAKARMPTSEAFSLSRRCSMTTVGASSGAWGRSGTPLGMTSHGEPMESATNWLMAMSQPTTRLVTRARVRATGPDPRPLAKCRVATTGARRNGRASHAAPSAAVMWTWTRSTWPVVARAPAADARWAADRLPTRSGSSARIRAGSPPRVRTRWPRRSSSAATWQTYRSAPAKPSVTTTWTTTIDRSPPRPGPGPGHQPSASTRQGPRR